jgi:hypothetical protein
MLVFFLTSSLRVHLFFIENDDTEFRCHGAKDSGYRLTDLVTYFFAVIVVSATVCALTILAAAGKT